MGEEGCGILLKAPVKVDFLLSFRGSKLLSRRRSVMCGAEANDSSTLPEGKGDG